MGLKFTRYGNSLLRFVQIGAETGVGRLLHRGGQLFFGGYRSEILMHAVAAQKARQRKADITSR